jgi:hypothetical protein
MLHVKPVVGWVIVIVIDTRDPVTVPVSVPLLVVKPYVPESDAPDCEIVRNTAHET